MIPPIRIHDALYIPHLRCLFFFGATPRICGPETLTIQLRKEGEVLQTRQCGVQPIAPSLGGLVYSEIAFLESGLFYGLLLDIDSDTIDEITAGYSGSALVRRRSVQQADWSPQYIAASRDVVDALSPEAVSSLTQSSQLRILALSALVWLRCNPSLLGTVSDLVASQVGEAMRKSVMKSLCIPLLAAQVPSQKTESSPGYSHRFDLLADALEHNASTVSICLADMVINGESSWVNTNMGHYHFSQRDIAKADGYYLQAAQILRHVSKRNIHFNNGVFTWRSHAFSETIEKLNFDPHAVTYAAQGDITIENSIVHLLGCDDSYFNKYGNMCIYSSLRAGPADVVVHVHVCNPSAATLRTLQGWQERSDVKVRYSYEYRNEVEISVPYYTTLRFLIAPQIMERYNSPVVISDIDMVVNQPWSDTLDAIGDADAGYISGSPEEWISEHYGVGVRPWDVAAGTMYFANSETGRRFLRYVSAYIRTVISFPEDSEWYLNWGVDQVALRKGVDIVLNPSQAKVRNLRSVRMLRGPLMHMGGKAALAQEPAPTPWEIIDLPEASV